MSEDADWGSASWEGNRLRQHREFLALPFREKLRRLEQLAEVAAFFAARRRDQEGPRSGTPDDSGR